MVNLVTLSFEDITVIRTEVSLSMFTISADCTTTVVMIFMITNLVVCAQISDMLCRRQCKLQILLLMFMVNRLC